MPGPSSFKLQAEMGDLTLTLHLITKGHQTSQEIYYFSKKENLSLLSLKSYNGTSKQLSVWGQGIYGNSLYFLLHFAMNLKLL